MYWTLELASKLEDANSNVQYISYKYLNCEY